MQNQPRARPNLRPDRNGTQRALFESNKKRIYGVTTAGTTTFHRMKGFRSFRRTRTRRNTAGSMWTSRWSGWYYRGIRLLTGMAYGLEV